MTLLVQLRDAPEGLEGWLSRWLVEVGPGLFVGKVNRRQREDLVARVSAKLESGSAVFVWPAPQSPLGVEWRGLGEARREPLPVPGAVLSFFRAEDSVAD